MKNILISIMITGLLLAGLVFAVPSTPVANNIGTATGNNTNYVVKFHVIGCTAPDCSGLSYCIDGGQVQYVNSCAFSRDLPAGSHTICVHCPDNKWGSASFTVTGPSFLDVYVYMQNQSGQDCSCTDSK